MIGKNLKKSGLEMLRQIKINWKRNLFIALMFCIVLFVPDFVARWGYNLNIHMEPLFLIGCFLVSILLSYCHTGMAIFFVSIIFVMQLIQLNYTVYFGSPIDASDIMNIVREARDVFDVSYLRETGLISATLILLYGGLIWLLIRIKRMKIKYIWIIILCLAAHKPYHAIRMSHDIWYFQPSITRPSFKNSLSTFSYFLFRYYPRGYTQNKLTYSPYTTRPTKSSTQQILVIFGESLYANHLQMFGYPRTTFPQMGKRLQDPKWSYKMAMSGGIATATSTLLFFNMMREPANHDVIQSQIANLFKIAHDNGFKTYYYSNQESRLTKGLGTKYIDKIITHDTNPVFFAMHKDEGLAQLVEELNFGGGKNFIVLHMRSPHSPYENRYKGREAEFEKFSPTDKASGRLVYETNTYDNALLYTDQAINKMISAFEKKVAGQPYSVYVTADHGQLFDYQGQWGHNNLVLEQGHVPFFYRMNTPTDVPEIVSHYQIGKLIARDLGTLVDNPNEDGSYYLHGNNVDFPYGYIQYKPQGNTVVELLKGNTGQK